MKNRPHNREQRRCIFCGEPGVNKEHLWSDWMGELLAKGPRIGRRRFYAIRGDDQRTTRLQPGDTFTVKIKAPCYTCNNGWMRRSEDATKPHLTPLIDGTATIVRPEQTRLIAKWLVKKAMVAEFSAVKTTAISQAQRTHLYRTGEIPDWFNIWIGPFRSKIPPRYMHAILQGAPKGRPDHPPVRHTQMTVWTLGKLIAVVHSTIDPAYNPDGRGSIERAMFRIWPPSDQPIDWRRGLVLTDADAENLPKLLSNSVAAVDDRAH